MMKEKLKRQLATLNKETEDIFQDVGTLDKELLNKQGSGWSFIQVFVHLEMSEAASLGYMIKKLNAGENMKKGTIVHTMMMRFTNLMLTTSLRWKAPSFISQPSNDYDLPTIKDKWMETRASLEKYLDAYPSGLLGRLVFKHPMAGRQTLSEALGSFIYHQRHHLHQIKRIKKELTS